MKPFTLVVAIGLMTGCASLPTLRQSVRAAPRTGQPPVIMGAGEVLSAQETRALISRLKREAEPTKILDRHLRFMEEIRAAPLTAGNRATLLVDRPATYAAMSAAIVKAKDHINAEFYIFEDDTVGKDFASLLLKKQADGVQVNLIYDSVGSMNTLSAFFERLRSGGINVLEFNPIDPLKVRKKWLLTDRDHRKILVVDGTTAFTGGTNISRVYSFTHLLKGPPTGVELPWRDTNVKIEGPAVAEFQELFLDTWRSQNGPNLPRRNYFPPLKARGDDLVRVIGSKPGEKHRMTYLMYLSAIRNARTWIHLTSAYFVPDHRTLEALEDASRRGVDVKLVLPAASDSGLAFYAGRSHYADLLEAGVQIYERENALLHAKTAEIDGVWSTIGSTNMDLWSFARNNEVNAAIISPSFAAQMEAMFQTDIRRSRRITSEQWGKRPLKDRVKEWLARLASYWL